MKICMIGTGYVGLVSGACFADLGNTVYCVDKDQEKIDMLNSGEIPIYEPGLIEIVRKNYFANRLQTSQRRMSKSFFILASHVIVESMDFAGYFRLVDSF